MTPYTRPILPVSMALIAGATLAGIVALGIAARWNGMRLSFWMDEAWVANSLLSGSWSELFYYSSYLQTSPPGFLLLAKFSLSLTGATPLALRTMPFASGVIGLLLLCVLARRTLRPLFVILAVTIVALSPTAVMYSYTLKQYSTEFAAAALVLLVAWVHAERPTRVSYVILAVAIVAALSSAYGSLLVIGGVLVLTSPVSRIVTGERVRRGDSIRWVGLVLLTGLVLAIEYRVFYLPNSSPELTRFWMVTAVNRPGEDLAQIAFRHAVILARHTPLVTGTVTIALAIAAGLVGCGMVRGLRRQESRRRAWTVLCLCGLPALAIVFASVLSLYPNSSRTSLVVLPGLALLVGNSCQWCQDWLEEAVRGRGWRPVLPRAAGVCFALATVALVSGGVAINFAPLQPYEDYREAVRYLRQRVQTDDIVFVHACCEEGFRLYRRLEPWATSVSIALGETGQPCCRPNRSVTPVAEGTVWQDLLQHVGPAFRGNVWLFYVDRLDYWRYSSRGSEGPMLVRALESVGCVQRQHAAFVQMAVDHLDCSGRDGGAAAVPAVRDVVFER